MPSSKPTWQYPMHEKAYSKDDLDRAVAESMQSLMIWLRHKRDCPVGNHCEDPFCHHRGDCTCGLDAAIQARGRVI